jgi:hypothetical protein
MSLVLEVEYLSGVCFAAIGPDWGASGFVETFGCG